MPPMLFINDTFIPKRSAGKLSTLTTTAAQHSSYSTTDRRGNRSVRDKSVEKKKQTSTKAVQSEPVTDGQRRSTLLAGKSARPVIHGRAQNQVISGGILTQMKKSSSSTVAKTSAVTVSKSMTSKNGSKSLAARTSQVAARNVRKPISEKLGKPTTNRNDKSFGKQQPLKSASAGRPKSLSSVRIESM